MNIMERYTDWQKYATHLSEYTPLSERQAQVLALKKMESTVEEISNKLDCQPEAVENLWDDVIEQWNIAQNFCGIMGPHPRGDEKLRKNHDFDHYPWRLRSSCSMSYSDEERTRIDLELYGWGTHFMANRYLLIEREISDTADYSTKTTEHRSAHMPNALRNYIHRNVDTIDEYFLRVALMMKADIEPNSDYSPSFKTILGRIPTNTEREEALEKAMSKVDSHWD